MWMIPEAATGSLPSRSTVYIETSCPAGWDKREKEFPGLMTSELYFQRMEERDLRKAKLKEKKEQGQNEALLQAIKVSS